jgi:magnesium chelatase subunit I
VVKLVLVRESGHIDNKSGVSARLKVSQLCNLLSTAERRALKLEQTKLVYALSDFMGIIPAITGK